MKSEILQHDDTFNLLMKNMVASFPHVIKPSLNNIDKDPAKHFEEYTIDLLFSKTTDLTEMEKVMNEVKADKWPTGAPEFRNQPIKDGDKKVNRQTGEISQGYEGMWYITAKAGINNKPVVMNSSKEELTRPDAIVGGDVVHAYISVFAYNHPVNKGVSWGLHTIRLAEKTDTPFGGGVSRKAAAAALDAFEDADFSV